MLELLSLLIVAAPWPLAVWMAYSLRRLRGPVHGYSFAAVVLGLLAAIYTSGYHAADELTGEHHWSEAAFALASMTLKAYGLLLVAMVVLRWLVSEKVVKE